MTFSGRRLLDRGVGLIVLCTIAVTGCSKSAPPLSQSVPPPEPGSLAALEKDSKDKNAHSTALCGDLTALTAQFQQLTYESDDISEEVESVRTGKTVSCFVTKNGTRRSIAQERNPDPNVSLDIRRCTPEEMTERLGRVKGLVPDAFAGDAVNLAVLERADTSRKTILHQLTAQGTDCRAALEESKRAIALYMNAMLEAKAKLIEMQAKQTKPK